MKTIIISDAKSHAPTIIPYGLNLAKTMDTQVDVIHVVDSRIHHGPNSTYADSQSIAPGDKMSVNEIIAREKKNAAYSLDQILSREASRLNHPLKVNTIVEQNSIENKLNFEIDRDPSAVLVVNKEADSHIFSDTDEIVDTIRNIGATYLLVPPGYKFSAPRKIAMLTDFSNRDYNRYTQIALVLKRFSPVIEAVSVGRGNSGTVEDAHHGGWLQFAEKIFTGSTVIPRTLKGKQFMKTLTEYLKAHQPDMLVWFPQKKSFLNRLLQGDLPKKLMKHTSVPILIYSGE